MGTLGTWTYKRTLSLGLYFRLALWLIRRPILLPKFLAEIVSQHDACIHFW